MGLVESRVRAASSSAPPSAKPLRAACSLHAAIACVGAASEAAAAAATLPLPLPLAGKRAFVPPPPEPRAPVRCASWRVVVDREAAGSSIMARCSSWWERSPIRREPRERTAKLGGVFKNCALAEFELKKG